MRGVAFSAVVLLGACGGGGSPGQPGPAGPMGLQGIPGPAGPAAKVPHLVVAATGEDLGFAMGLSAAYSPAHSLVIEYVYAPTFYYEDDRCAGAPHLPGTGGQNRSVAVIREGTLLVVDGPPLDVRFLSFREDAANAKCEQLSPTDPTRRMQRMMDSKIATQRRSLSELAIELR